MADKLTEETIRGWSTEELQQKLQNETSALALVEQMYALDELFHRKANTTQLPITIEHLVTQLDDKTLTNIEHEPLKFARKTIHFSINEKIDRGLDLLAWYYSVQGSQKGPFNRNQIFELARTGHLSPQNPIWREGWDDWARAGEMEGLFPKYGSSPNTPPPNNPNNAFFGNYQVPPTTVGGYSVPGGLVVAGILQFMCVPYWIITGFIQAFNPLTGLGDSMRVPALLMCLVMGAFSIAIGIGLVGGKKWSYHLTLILVSTGLLYIFYRLIHSGHWELYWIFFAIIEIVVIGLVVSNSKRFRTTT